VKKILIIIGTRPETIKMAPVYHALVHRAGLEIVVCATGQHRDIVAPMALFFQLPIDEDMEVMKPNQDLFDLTARVLLRMRDTLKRIQPDLVLTQGDTTTVMAASMAAFYLGIPVGHVEAGLRTYHMRNPFPEEMNRVVTDTVSSLHFAPTPRARQALVNAGVAEECVHVTGNTVIDALFYTLDKVKGPSAAMPDHGEDDRVILLTTHRRESFGAPIRSTFAAVRQLVNRYPDLHIVYPVHPNPNVKEVAEECLHGTNRVHLLPPQPYPEFVQLMRDCDLILTDSGGVQEEAPSLGKPVLVLRETTERPEGIEAGTARLIGTDTDRIVSEVARLIDDPQAYAAMANATNPYGDGKAGERIADIIANL